MKLKLDENQNAVIENAMPVYVYDDGREAPLDAAAMARKIQNLTEEKDRHYSKWEEANKALKKFEGIEDPAAALKALETVANLDAKKLVDANDMESLKRQLIENAENEKTALIKNFETEKENLLQSVTKKDQAIFDLMVTSEFAKSPFFSGKEPLTIVPHSMAAKNWRDNFKVEDIDGRPTVVGYYNGEKILSKKRHGEIADFHEAIEVIIDKYPMKDQIMASGYPGPGGHGNQNNNNAQNQNLTSTQRIAKGIKSITGR